MKKDYCYQKIIKIFLVSLNINTIFGVIFASININKYLL